MTTSNIIGQYTRTEEKIGSGSTAKVWKGFHIREKFPVAIKIVTKKKLSHKLLTCIESEISSLKNLSHPNLIQMYNIYRDKQKIYIITEFCEKGDLKTWIEKNTFDEKQIKAFLKDIVKGINFLHKRNHIHRDIKSGNILLTKDQRAKIADFGFTRYVDEDELATTICGTPAYLAPEIVKKLSYDNKVDIWSLGVLFYEMVYKKVPIQVLEEKDQSKILSDEIVFPESDLSDLGLDLMKKMLQSDPKKRANIQQVIEHPYLNMKGDTDVLSETTILVEQFEVIDVQDIDKEKESSDNGTGSYCIIA